MEAVMKKEWMLIPALALTFVACEKMNNQSTSRDVNAEDVDNTARNAGDSSSVTPTDQGENESDLKITQNIRKALLKDDSLSENAKNIKVITRNGVVTLRGVVENNKEQDAILKIVGSQRGIARVDNLLNVKNSL